MKKFIIAFACIVLAISCNDDIDLSGNNGVHEFLPEVFSEITVQDGFELYWSYGDTAKVRIETDGNIVSHVRHTVKNNVLSFYKDPEAEFPSEALVKIYVTKDTINSLKALSSKIKLADTLVSQNITLDISKSSVLEGAVKCNQLIADIKSSTLKLSGNAGYSFVNVLNNSNADSYNLISDYLSVNIMGGSTANFTANTEISVNAIEGSIVNYKGTAVVRKMLLDDGSQMNKK